jgi:hypothetical protein
MEAEQSNLNQNHNAKKESLGPIRKDSPYKAGIGLGSLLFKGIYGVSPCIYGRAGL